MSEPEKITIVEGPPPTFEQVADVWALSLAEGALPTQVSVCRLRTLDGPALVERCQRAWNKDETVKLEYRDMDGLIQEVPILAIRWVEQASGHVLLVWVRMEQDEIEVEIDFEFDDDDDPFDDPFGPNPGT